MRGSWRPRARLPGWRTFLKQAFLIRLFVSHSLTYFVSHSLTYFIPHSLTYFVSHSLTYFVGPFRFPFVGLFRWPIQACFRIRKPFPEQVKPFETGASRRRRIRGLWQVEGEIHVPVVRMGYAKPVALVEPDRIIPGRRCLQDDPRQPCCPGACAERLE